MNSPLPLPALSATAHRSLADAGITDLRQLDGMPERQLLSFHGLGPAQAGVVRDALAAHGLALSAVSPRKKPTGRNDLSTTFSGQNPRDWIGSLSKPRQVQDGLRLLEIFGAATGADPAMWGPSIVGYGHHHYVYDTGREGDTPQVAFSPRSSAISLYGLLGLPGTVANLEKLGPHKLGKGCLYVTTLGRIDEGVLAEMVREGWNSPGAGC